MSVLGATLLVLAGLAIMGFGIFLFYAWLPFLYGLFELEIGLLLGRWLTGGIGLVAIIFGIVSAVILFCAAYFLEPYRRILLGLSAGAMVGLSIAAVFGLDHFLGGVIGVILAVVGAAGHRAGRADTNQLASGITCEGRYRFFGLPYLSQYPRAPAAKPT